MKKKIYKTNDFDVRAAVVRRLLSEGVARRDIRHELTLNTSSSGGRADIVVLFDNALYGVEVKSGRDVLDRCLDQFETYSKAFDAMIFCVDKKHLQTIEDTKKYHWRISYRTRYYCHDLGDFFHAETARINERQENGRLTWDLGRGIGKSPIFRMLDWAHKCSQTSTCAMSRLLWRDEANAIIKRMGMAGKGTRCGAIDYFSEHCSLANLRPLIIEQLRNRTLSEWEINFWKKVDTANNGCGV